MHACGARPGHVMCLNLFALGCTRAILHLPSSVLKSMWQLSWNICVTCALACGILPGRWEVRIGLRGSKHVYLGLHHAELEAARVYDRALVLLTGPGAATNFPVSAYATELAAYQKCALPLLLLCRQSSWSLGCTMLLSEQPACCLDCTLEVLSEALRS